MNTKIAIIGLGYVGLPLAMLFASKDYPVIGIDIDQSKVEKIKSGKSYLSDLSDQEVEAFMKTGRVDVTSDFSRAKEAEAILLCVPTPLREHKYPDLSYLQTAISTLLPHLQKGQLLVLESSTFPGTTEEVMLEMVEKAGFAVGEDLFIGYSPERIDPGNHMYTLGQIPKVVSGVTDKCLKKVTSIYGAAFETLVPVSSPKVAEMTKILENAQRLINISFMNEMAQICHGLDIDIWEVIQAASTKPYGFTPYYPGPGIGGHCIPVDPLYLKWKANNANMPTAFIDLAKDVNDAQPRYIMKRIEELIGEPAEEKSVLLIGMTYKRDVNDIRESMSVPVMEHVIGKGYQADYYDPYVEEIEINQQMYQSIALEQKVIESYNCVVILTDHSQIDYTALKAHAKLILDTRNRISDHSKNVIRL
ncbi:nucleotide sugar dehydrogenase [Alkalihalobacillus oceani]|uniref:Nucleotide sugar dehydrogenase n=1 Tax=Halalkalibacter oceani TaxID=1653776 RepID=A0A9X2DRW3_9BACI|nr:nucleotide sugar dehydrogenase [Halalkalibacter oceani]MCM3715561.1 nucleotide sugar dehydrogenase [Halalkalibacter oceani]